MHLSAIRLLRQWCARPLLSAPSPHTADLAPTYEAVCAEMGWPLDESKLDAMRAANAAKLEVPAVRNLSVLTSETRLRRAGQDTKLVNSFGHPLGHAKQLHWRKEPFVLSVSNSSCS